MNSKKAYKKLKAIVELAYQLEPLARNRGEYEEVFFDMMYNRVVSNLVSFFYNHYNIWVDYCDPDTSYYEDALARFNQIKEILAIYEKEHLDQPKVTRTSVKAFKDQFNKIAGGEVL